MTPPKLQESPTVPTSTVEVTTAGQTETAKAQEETTLTGETTKDNDP